MGHHQIEHTAWGYGKWSMEWNSDDMERVTRYTAPDAWMFCVEICHHIEVIIRVEIDLVCLRHVHIWCSISHG